MRAILWIGLATAVAWADSLPNFDKRKSAPGNPLLRQADRSKADWIVERDGATGSPRLIRGANRFLTQKPLRAAQIGVGVGAGADPADTVKSFVRAQSNLFGHGPEVFERAVLKRDDATVQSGLRTMSWQQVHEGIEVFQGIFTAHLTRDSELVRISSRFLKDPPGAVEEGTPQFQSHRNKPPLEAAEAVRLAAANIGAELKGAEIKGSEYEEGGERRQKLWAAALKGPARAKLVWLPMSPGVARLCWQVELRHSQETYRVLVDASNGEVLLRHALTVYLSDATYRVFASDSPTPFSPGHPQPRPAQPARVERRLITVGALSTNASPGGWIEDGGNETLGNNVEAHTDLNDDDLPDLPRPRGSPRRYFDFPLDLELGPRTYSNAAVVQLFYWNNWVHDRFYDLGFTEAAGNFQKLNFGRGGVEGDPVEADAQDGGGFNNANFTTSEDGIPGRMQMYLFNGPAPDRDGSLDTEIVLHEYTHGLTTRLVGGGNALNELQPGGLGEGWSDFYALALLSESGDDLNGAFAAGAYASFALDDLAENYYFGIRRYPYSIDPRKNPLTLKDIDPTQISAHPGVPVNPIFAGFSAADEVHAQGEVWCVALWEARAQLIARHGFEQGNRLILELVTDGLKLTPPEPTFLEARDAILEADLVSHGGANAEALWAAFAKRGLGFSAEVPRSSTTVGVVEAFDVPDDLLVRPAQAFVSSGAEGGPFSPAERLFTLRNASTNQVRWSVERAARWLEVAPSGGTIEPGGDAQELRVTLNSLAESLPAGLYHDRIVLTNHVTGRGQAREVTLRVAQPDYFTTTFSAEGDGHPFAYASVTFTPEASPSSYRACFERSEGFPVEAALGSALDLGDDDFRELVFEGGSAFPFFGTSHTNLFVSGNGYLTFGRGATDFEPNLASHFSGPRISALFTDLDPSFGGIVSWAQLPDRVVVTFEGVPLFLDPAPSSFQIELFWDGVIRITWLDLAAEHGLVGLSAGEGLPEGFAPTMFAELNSCQPEIAITVPESVREDAGTLRGEVRIPSPLATNLSLALGSRLGTAENLLVLTLAAGETNHPFSLPIEENPGLNGTRILRLGAQAPGFNPGAARVLVHDADPGELVLEIPESGTEGSTGRGVVRAAGTLAQPVIVRLLSGAPETVVIPSVVLLSPESPASEFEISFPDDGIIKETETVTVSARVENWVSPQRVIAVADNEPRTLRLTVSPTIGEGTAVKRGAGQVAAPGVVQKPLLVRLRSEQPSLISLPDSVLIPAGASNVFLDLEASDNALIDAATGVRLHAEADGFSASSAIIAIQDDERPSMPAGPVPAHLSAQNGPEVDLAWAVAAGPVFPNSDFESGQLAPWRTEGSGSGRFVINDGTVDPEGPGLPAQPFAGKYGVLSQQSGPSKSSIYQQLVIPPGTVSAKLSWQDRIENHAPFYLNPSQSFRVEIKNLAGEILAVPFTTQQGDPLLTDWTRREIDLDPFIGQEIRIHFVQEGLYGYFNVHLDNLQVELDSGPVREFAVYFGTQPNLGSGNLLGLASTNHWPLAPLALDTTYYWRVAARNDLTEISSPVWQFRVAGVGAITRFHWDGLPAAVFAGEPFPVRLLAQDTFGNTAASFHGQAQVRARQDFPIITAGRGREAWDYPLGGYFPVSRLQAIYLQSEVGPARRLTGLALDVRAVPSQTLERFTVRLQHTTRSEYRPGDEAWERAGWTVAAQRDLVAEKTGWLVIPFDTPFEYDGTNHLWIDFSFRNSGFGADGQVHATLTRTTRAIGQTWFSGDPLSWLGQSPYPDPYDQLPNVQFLSETAVPIVSVVSTALAAPGAPVKFNQGVWAGELTPAGASSGTRLVAEDSLGHKGESEPFEVRVRNDVSLAAGPLPESVSAGGKLVYNFLVRNAGPAPAANLVLSNRIGLNATFSSATTSQGRFESSSRLALFFLGDLPGGSQAAVSVTVSAEAAGVITNVAQLMRSEPDADLPNNLSALTTQVLPPPEIDAENASAVEGSDAELVFELVLSEPGSEPVSVSYQTAPGSADAQDFQARSGAVAFAPGETRQTVRVPITDDLVDESDESLQLVLTSPVRATLGDRIAFGTIIDNEGPDLRVEDASMVEGSSPGTTPMTFVARLSATSVQEITASFRALAGTALEGSDFMVRTGVVTFPPGTVERTISVAIVKDREVEPAERLILALEEPSGARITRGKAYGVIVNDDGLPGDLDHFEFGSLASPQFLDEPFAIEVLARDRFGGPATNFQATAALAASVDLPPVRIGEGEFISEFPLDISFEDLRMQIIYPATELGESRAITGLGLFVGHPPGLPLRRWTIRMKHTSLDEYPLFPRWESSGWTTVYQADESLSRTGLVTFAFSRPFAYDGVRNIMVDFSFENDSYDFDLGEVFATFSSTTRAIVAQSDSFDGDPLTWSGVQPSPTEEARIPNIVLLSSRSIPLSPNATEPFEAGRWAGPVAAQALASGVVLTAKDAEGHAGQSGAFDLLIRDDLSLSIEALPGLVTIGGEFQYRLAVTNSGPAVAREVVVTHPLPPGVTLLQTESSAGGTIEATAEQLTWTVAELEGGTQRAVTVLARAPDSAGILEVAAAATRLEPEKFLENNRVSARTAVLNRPDITLVGGEFIEGEAARFSAQLSEPSSVAVTVDYRTEQGTARAGDDFLPNSGSIRFEPGSTNVVITIALAADTVDELPEEFTVRLANPQGGLIAAGESVGLIVDDDGPEIVTQDQAVLEGNSGETQLRFTLALTAPTVEPVSVDFRVGPGTAQAGSDFVPQEGTLVFPPGSTSTNLLVAIRTDLRLEADELLELELSNPQAAALPTARFTGTILNDDGLPGEVDNFRFDPVPSPTFSGRDQFVSIMARDGLLNRAVQFSGAATVEAEQLRPPVIIGEGEEPWDFPMGGFASSKLQTIYYPEELGGAFQITSLGLYLLDFFGDAIVNTSLRIQHTSLAAFARTSAWVTNGWTTVFSRSAVPVAAMPGWVEFPLTQPFSYDGTNNLLIEFTVLSDGDFFPHADALSTVAAAGRSIGAHEFGFGGGEPAPADPLDWTGRNPTPALHAQFPNLRITGKTPIPVEGGQEVRFQTGLWRGTLRLNGAASAVRLLVRDALGHTGFSDNFALASAEDTDRDGLPDAWELAMGLDAGDPDDAAADSDRDGVNNLQEFQAGTVSNDPRDVLRFFAAGSEPGRLTLRALVVPGRAYLVERSAGLGGNWSELARFPRAESDVLEITDVSAPPGTGHFYRVRTLDP